MREEKEDVIFFFVVWSALIGSGWVGGGWLAAEGLI